MILIQGARIIDPASGRDETADLVIGEDGRIAWIGSDAERADIGSDRPSSVDVLAALGNGDYSETPFDEVISAHGLVLAPGLVDVHVHFRDPGQTWKEDIFTGAAAAAAGGYTTVVCMANTTPPVDCVPVLEELILRWERPILPIPGMADFVRDCRRAGYGIYLLSNASRRLHQYWTGIPGHEYFDGEFVSADYQLVKPDQSIYRKFCQVFELEPRECLFIDDFPLNIEGAVTAGWQGIVFHDVEDLRKKAHAMGVRIPLEAKK